MTEKTIGTMATETYEKVIETRKASREKKEAYRIGINYKAVNVAVVDIISLFGEDFKGDVVDLVVVTLKKQKWIVTCQSSKGTVTEKTRCKKSIREKLKRLNSLNITNTEREVIEEAVAKYCNILVSDKKSLIFRLNMDIED